MDGQITGNLKKVLDTTLDAFLDLVQCDAGSVFTLRKDKNGVGILKFEAMMTRSLGIREVPEHLRNLQFSVDDSTIVGKTAASRETTLLSLDLEQSQSAPGVAKVMNYETRNIFSAPLVTPRGDLVGVVQLLNKLPQGSAPFSPEDTTPLPPFNERDQALFSIIVGQSALAIENSLLLEEQERLMEGFVDACVTAIEARDPVTSGHSRRVAVYTVGLAEAVNRTDAGVLKNIAFTSEQVRELRFASMLHDVGKIGIREAILQKQKKLQPYELEIISMRFKLMRAQMMLLQETEKEDYSCEIQRLECAWKQVLEANEPLVLAESTSRIVETLRSLQVRLGPGETLSALTDEEVERLSLRQGSLSEAERIEVQTHVEKTYEILQLIPWSRGLEQVPCIASMHHESLDGSGYPRGVTAESIPPQARMMAICDVYDALRAGDRPYKPALTAENALDLVAAYVKSGKLDGNYFDVFLKARIYRQTGKWDTGTPGGTDKSRNEPVCEFAS
jgi:HD-GYP domain-containing protein (c-di-GMP phosphodiesterase class II)